ncbi:MAG: beta-ketoacyl-[acyl-carrier-protein] synthase family protein [Bacteroidia bacterium]|nr:beta-ketoacyl-[acyl-carrier-protein] synthase family protein [Bacteroidia bacterium]
MKIFITGIGVISPIGTNVPQTLESFKHSKAGIADFQILNTRHQGQLPVAEVKFSNEELAKMGGVDPKDGFSRTALLAVIAAKEAVKDAGILEISEEKTGLISANTVGGMGTSENHYKSFLDYTKTGDFLRYIDTHDCGESTERIADSLGITDYLATISTACSSSANSLMFGAKLIENGIVDRVVAGGADSLCRFTLNGFNTLMILDKQECRPYDKDRQGLNLGEGAGFVVLESEALVKKYNKKPYAELKGYANACDAYHQTASSPDGAGAYAAMKQAIDMAGLNPSDIDYINLHGTATLINDQSEGRAVQNLFGDQVPYASSTKSFTGHTLGAAGGIEAVFSCLAIRNGMVFPNLRFSERIEDLRFEPVKKLLENVEISSVLSNSFGFGGNNSALLFTKPE